jgi:hypothetical protein
VILKAPWSDERRTGVVQLPVDQPDSSLGTIVLERIVRRYDGSAPMSAIFSFQGLARAASIGSEDFVLIGSSCQVQCTRFQAAFLSPRVHLLLQEDATVDSLFIEFRGREIDETRMLGFLHDLMNGLGISPSVSEAENLVGVAAFLGNTELLNWFLPEDGPIEQSNVCSRLKRKSAIGRSVDAEVAFAALHFYELDLNELRGVEVSILERIVSCPCLRLENEDSLLDFIVSLECPDAILLLRYLQSEYLTIHGVSILLDHLSDSDLDWFAWESLCRRLRLPVSHQKGNHGVQIELTARPPGVPLPVKSMAELDGIIAHLTAKHDGNVHDKGIVAITASSVFHDMPNCASKHVVDLTAGSEWFQSGSAPEQWICWDFRGMRIRPTHYAIWTRRLKSWIVEGSVDGESWTEIDRQQGSRAFIGHLSTIASFPVSAPAEYRFIRLTGHCMNDCLSLRAVEFFGALLE